MFWQIVLSQPAQRPIMMPFSVAGVQYLALCGLIVASLSDGLGNDAYTSYQRAVRTHQVVQQGLCHKSRTRRLRRSLASHHQHGCQCQQRLVLHKISTPCLGAAGWSLASCGSPAGRLNSLNQDNPRALFKATPNAVCTVLGRSAPLCRDDQ